MFQPTDRLKTEEEIAKAEMDKLQNLEVNNDWYSVLSNPELGNCLWKMCALNTQLYI